MTKEHCMPGCHISSVKTVGNCHPTWKRSRQVSFYGVINADWKDISKESFVKVDCIGARGIVICLETDVHQGPSLWKLSGRALA